MSDWSREMAPVVARIVKWTFAVALTIGTIVFVFQFLPADVRKQAFDTLDKYAPTISAIFK